MIAKLNDLYIRMPLDVTPKSKRIIERRPFAVDSAYVENSIERSIRNGQYQVHRLDVHKEAIAIAVLNGVGKLVMESIIETKASTILQFIQGLRGDLYLTFEEGTWAAWLYDVLKTARDQSRGVQPPQECLTERGQQE
jgi:hypothetical protein